ncbi:hypothetical protein [Legionella tucsonensis]|uniref:Uncharacterized protein n=1 Tax=Legionella tucsonensis TaxID=40335 RepID=A0A0W0ZWZ3_9GAMM|nr:hypothetical protein [Legionella tucsonensis]KTD73433.1 hypothetical protein Ltuc_1280 [Legionella tucsonensis]
MMSKEAKEANGEKSSSNTKKTWSFLDTSKRILEEEKSQSAAAKKTIKDKDETSNNMIEVEPDINQLFKHK